MKIIFLGPPGSGKGSYASRLSPIMEIPHISTGDLFRENMKNKTELGIEANKYIEKGDLVPDEITIRMLKERIERPDCKNGFILDGYPRNLQQAEALDKLTGIDIVILLNIPKELLIEKIAARRICRNCGKIYNIADITFEKYRFPPLSPKKEGICDDCGGELYQRDDETPEVVENRLKVYENDTKPLVDFYKSKNILQDVDVIGSPQVMMPIILKAVKGD